MFIKALLLLRSGDESGDVLGRRIVLVVQAVVLELHARFVHQNSGVGGDAFGGKFRNDEICSATSPPTPQSKKICPYTRHSRAIRRTMNASKGFHLTLLQHKANKETLLPREQPEPDPRSWVPPAHRPSESPPRWPLPPHPSATVSLRRVSLRLTPRRVAGSDLLVVQITDADGSSFAAAAAGAATAAAWFRDRPGSVDPKMTTNTGFNPVLTKAPRTGDGVSVMPTCPVVTRNNSARFDLVNKNKGDGSGSTRTRGTNFSTRPWSWGFFAT